jgi:hypothetical protein
MQVREASCGFDSALVEAMVVDESPSRDQLPLADPHALAHWHVQRVDDVDDLTLRLRGW